MIIREMDDDQSVIAMIDSNLQRGKILQGVVSRDGIGICNVGKHGSDRTHFPFYLHFKGGKGIASSI